jgi:bifunctional non-homologous end joining protein LigD
MPTLLDPMLPTLVKQPFSNPEWLFEVKWDGFRALCFLPSGGGDLAA